MLLKWGREMSGMFQSVPDYIKTETLSLLKIENFWIPLEAF